MKIKKKVIKKEKCRCKDKKENCKSCNNTGIFKDHIYYHIDEKNKICVEGDTIK